MHLLFQRQAELGVGAGEILGDVDPVAGLSPGDVLSYVLHQPRAIRARGIRQRRQRVINALAEEIKPPKRFVLPGENETEALAHLARAKTRVCEILAWEIKAKAAAVYLNRLSDYLFLVALKSAR